MGEPFGIGETGMIKKITDKNHILQLTLLCCAVYFASYMTRLSFGAVIAEIIASEGYAKPAVAVVTTALFVTYGGGQLISGMLGDRLDPGKIIFIGLVTSVVMNLAIPFCPSPWMMAVVWGINGFAQAMIWPPLVKILTNFLTNEEYKKATVRVSIASAAGTISVYLFAPLLITISGWRLMLFFAAGLAAVVAAVWLLFEKRIYRYAEQSGVECAEENSPSIVRNGKAAFARLIIPAGLIFIMFAIVMQGALRDGVTTWMPTYIVDTFKLSGSKSILTAVVMPMFSIISFKVTAYVYSRWLRNEVFCAGVMLFCGAICSLILTFAFSHSVALSVLLSALITGSMHGANLMLVCMVPAQLARFGKAATASGVLNSCTYIGSALSTYGIALVAERFGWAVTIGMWAIIAFAGALACAAVSRRWKRFLWQEL